MENRKIVIVAVIAFAAGCWWSGDCERDEPKPPDRPVLRWIAKAAKNALWIMLVAEPPPDDEPQPVAHFAGGQIDHSRGW